MLLLEAGSIRAVVLPALGGRLISLRHGEREFLWHDRRLLDEAFRPRVPVVPAPPGAPMAAWQNWGGDKSWPAPQATGEHDDGWHGPPDPVLDGGPYRVVDRVVDRAGRTAVELRSGTDPRTGLEQTRAIEVHDGGVRVTTTITNRSEAAVRHAPWEVMQVAVSAEDEAGGSVEVERDAGPAVADLGRYWGSPTVTEHGRTTEVRLGGAVAKLGFPGATGRVRCRFADGATLGLAFAASPDAPAGAPFQLWIQTPLDHAPAGLGGWQPADRLVELEPLGALRDLAPGGSASLVADWTPRSARATSGGSRSAPRS